MLQQSRFLGYTEEILRTTELHRVKSSELSTLGAQRSTLNAHAQRSTLHAQRSTLNAQRSTLNAQRSTLNAIYNSQPFRYSLVRYWLASGILVIFIPAESYSTFFPARSATAPKRIVSVTGPA
jgi:hypothetical protein